MNVEKYNSRSLLFALFVFITSTYLVYESKIDSQTYGMTVMATMGMYGVKRATEGKSGK